MTTKPVREEFTVHLLNDRGLERAAEIAEEYSAFLDRLEKIAGADGREAALVRTHLQIASYYSKRAIAVRRENQLGYVEQVPE